MRIPSIAIMSLLLAAQLLMASSSYAFDFFSHRQRIKARTQTETAPGCTGKQSPKYNYTSNAWPFTEARKFGATVIAVAATDPTLTDRGTKIRPFHFRALSVTVDHLVLDQVGLALYDSGRLFATGRINHSGGDGQLIGNNVTVRIRAYVSHTTAGAPKIERPAVVVSNPRPTETEKTTPDDLSSEFFANVQEAGSERAGADSEPDVNTTPEPEEIPLATPNSVTRIPPDAYRVWSSTQKFWVSRGRPKHVTLSNEGDDLHALRHHFDEITHLEVELEYERDR